MNDKEYQNLIQSSRFVNIDFAKVLNCNPYVKTILLALGYGNSTIEKLCNSEGKVNFPLFEDIYEKLDWVIEEVELREFLSYLIDNDIYPCLKISQNVEELMFLTSITYRFYWYTANGEHYLELVSDKDSFDEVPPNKRLNAGRLQAEKLLQLIHYKLYGMDGKRAILSFDYNKSKTVHKDELMIKIFFESLEKYLSGLTYEQAGNALPVIVKLQSINSDEDLKLAYSEVQNLLKQKAHSYNPRINEQVLKMTDIYKSFFECNGNLSLDKDFNNDFLRFMYGMLVKLQLLKYDNEPIEVGTDTVRKLRKMLTDTLKKYSYKDKVE